MDRAEARAVIIGEIAGKLRGAGCDVGTMPDRVRPEMAAGLARAATDRDPTTLSGAIMRETDAGLIFGNLNDAGRREAAISSLADAGVIPRVTPRGGMSAAFGGGREVATLLNEMIAQGMRSLSEAVSGPDDRDIGEIEDDVNLTAERVAKEAGLAVVTRVRPGAVLEYSLHDLRDALTGSDPDLGLTPGQNITLIGAKAGMQGLMRSSMEEGNLKNAHQVLVRMGLAADIDKPDFEAPEGAGFLRRIGAAAMHMMSGPDPDDHRRPLIESARELIRARMEDVLAEASRDNVPSL